MLDAIQILVSRRGVRLALLASVVAMLAACGQKGPLFLPAGEAAAKRATLPQTLSPPPPASAPVGTGTGTASPIPTR
ncbi:MAG: lipoprotein [Ramlibacter sp.]